MRAYTSFADCVALCLASCASIGSRGRIKPVEKVDLSKYIGSWRIIACTDNKVEHDFVDAVETYQFAGKGAVNVHFAWRDPSLRRWCRPTTLRAALCPTARTAVGRCGSYRSSPPATSSSTSHRITPAQRSHIPRGNLGGYWPGIAVCRTRNTKGISESLRGRNTIRPSSRKCRNTLKVGAYLRNTEPISKARIELVLRIHVIWL